jgi:hemolysin III
MHLLLADLGREQSHAEEMANSISHGVGLAAALTGAPLLIMHAVQYGNAGFTISAIVFAVTMIFLYFVSALYHALPTGRAKVIFLAIEHSAIFLLIAGTYTPFTLGVLRGAWGWTILWIVWGIAALGVVLKTTEHTPHPILSTSLYLLMGWIIVIAIGPLFTRMPTAGLLWLLAGGLFYTVGVIFFITDSRLRYGHLVWHLFVMAGTACHYCTVLWYAA